MTFQPGQFITAQRLNRLQPKTYWAQASGVTTTALTNADVAGTSMSITVDTNGATAAFWWNVAIYSNGGIMGNAASARVLWDVNVSPVVAVGYFSGNPERATPGMNWVTTIGTAGTYTFKMQVSTSTNTAIQVFTALTVQISEVV